MENSKEYAVLIFTSILALNADVTNEKNGLSQDKPYNK